MAEPEFSPEVRTALDSYAVPSLPSGFADRLLARIEAGDTAKLAPATGFANRLRRNGGGAWRRSSRIIGSVAFLSLATATAAAAGIFGSPVYVPGVSEVLAKTELVPASRYTAVEKSPVLAAKPKDVAVRDVPVQPANGTEAVVSRIEQLRENPKFENLTPRQKFIIARKEVRTMVRSGEATQQEARAAVRELVKNADPETKAQWREGAIARRKARLERREQLSEPAITQTDTQVTTGDTSEVAPISEELPLLATSNLSHENIAVLRQRYRDATPAERAEIRRTLRERRALRQQRRQ
jgi:polyhydroxyalkanoate synthesis regulator phasin